MYTFNADSIISYELGSEEPGQLAVNNINLFTQSADDILSRMGKVRSSISELISVGIIMRITI